jgi:integrase
VRVGRCRLARRQSIRLGSRTTTHGTPYESRNFNRHFTVTCRNAGVRYINPHGMRRTSGSVLAALDVIRA